MKDLLAKLDAHQVVNADGKRVEFDNGMVVSRSIKESSSSEVCLVIQVTITLGDGSYSDTSWTDAENRMIIKWFNDKNASYSRDSYDMVTTANKKLAKLIG